MIVYPSPVTEFLNKEKETVLPSPPFLSLTTEPKILKHHYTRSIDAVLSGIATPQALRHLKIATFVNNLHSGNFICKVEITSYHTTE